MTSEAKWTCPHCSRFHSDLVEKDKPIEPNDIIKCQFCTKNVIVQEITYFLHIRQGA